VVREDDFPFMRRVLHGSDQKIREFSQPLFDSLFHDSSSCVLPSLFAAFLPEISKSVLMHEQDVCQCGL